MSRPLLSFAPASISLQQCIEFAAQQNNIHAEIQPQHDKYDGCQASVHAGKSRKYIQVDGKNKRYQKPRTGSKYCHWKLLLHGCFR